MSSGTASTISQPLGTAVQDPDNVSGVGTAAPAVDPVADTPLLCPEAQAIACLIFRVPHPLENGWLDPGKVATWVAETEAAIVST